MQNPPTPLLGEITALTIATPDLEESLTFYRKLGFSEVMRADWPFPWIQVSDGVLLIMLRKDAKPYLALSYYVKNIDKVTADLAKKGVEFTQKPKKGDMLKRYLLKSPDGLNISLVSMVEGFKQPKGPGMLEMDPKNYVKPEKYVNKTIGLFGELAHPVADLEKSIAFWELLGFKAVSKFAAPYPWAIVSDGLSIVGLHQTRHFDHPAITYFAADMKGKISKLKKSGLKNFTEEGPSDIVLLTPEQQHINLFQMGMGADTSEKKKSVLHHKILETERMWLKELTPELMDELFTGHSDAEVMDFLGLKTDEELATAKSNWQKGLTMYRISFRSFVMAEKPSGRIIGKLGFHTWHLEHQRAEVGYAVHEDTDKNRGFMKEALKAVIRYGFEEMQLNRIEASVGTQNEPSLKLMKHFGFTMEGIMRSHYYRNGKMEDSAWFSLLKTEYKP
jgi:[ribosomal protein S5]-alanine N-acetyltransferase